MNLTSEQGPSFPKGKNQILAETPPSMAVPSHLLLFRVCSPDGVFFISSAAEEMKASKEQKFVQKSGLCKMKVELLWVQQGGGL